MSRGRQKRVEKNHQMRLESKKQKALKELRSSYKALIQTQLFPMIDALFDFKSLTRNSSPSALHLWVDQIPLSRRLDLMNNETQADDDCIDKKSLSDVTAAKRARRKSSTADSESLKTAVKDSIDDSEEGLLCRSQFFGGECSGYRIDGRNNQRKKNFGSQLCKFAHYSSDEMTLFQALMPSLASEGSRRKILHDASISAALAQIQVDDTVVPDPDHVNSIDMMYHIVVSPVGTKPGSTVSQLVSQQLVSENIPTSSIVYVVFSNQLLFDRFGGGKMVSEEDLEKLSRKMFGNQDHDVINRMIPIFTLSGHLLEMILAFLPSEYCGIIPSCCRSFYSEIGVHSPDLWKQGLDNHHWPHPILDVTDEMNDQDLILRYKEAFTSHFRVCRQIDSLANGILNMLNHNTPLPNHAVTKNGFNYKNEDTIVSIWDNNSVLIASASECFIRLCSVAELNSKHICEEVVGSRIAPTPFSKRNKWKLRSATVDDRYIVSSYETVSLENSIKELVVTSMMKDQLLTSSIDDEIISTGEILQCHRVRDHLNEFLSRRIFQGEEYESDGYDSLREIWIDSSRRQSLEILVDIQSPCGNGIFCSIIKISSNDRLGQNITVFEGIMTFSISIGRDFICDIYPVQFTGVVCTTNYYTKRRMDPTDILIGSDHLHDFVSISVNRNGTFQMKQVANEFVDFRDDEVVVTSKLLIGQNIVLSSLVKGRDADEGRILMYWSHKDESRDLYGNSSPSITLRNSYSDFICMNCLDNEEYLMILASSRAPPTSGELVDFNWNFITNADDQCSLKRLDMVLVHVPTKTEMLCSSIRHPVFDDQEIVPISVNLMQNGAITVAIGGVGICFIDASKCCSKDTDYDDIINKVKKLKIKKRLVAKTGRGGKKQGTGLVKL